MSDETRPAGSGATTPSAVDQWNRVVAEAYRGADREGATGVAEARASAEVSDAEIDRRLRDAGFDLADLDARADATYAAIVAKHFGAPATKEPDESQREPVWVADAGPRSRAIPAARRTRVHWLAYAIAAAAATGGAAYVAAHRHEEPRHDEPVVPPVPTITPVLTPVTPPPVAPTELPPDRKTTPH